MELQRWDALPLLLYWVLFQLLGTVWGEHLGHGRMGNSGEPFLPSPPASGAVAEGW